MPALNSKNVKRHIQEITREESKDIDELQRKVVILILRVDILTTEFQRLEGIIADLKMKNSQMLSSNYEMSVNLERSKVWEQKVSVLSEEIHRLERERMNLTEEISLCRMHFS